jgi:GH15 family glucan-1,4-alpha-glucosidase
MGPVRVGNAAFTQPQHDVYGSVALASAQLFFDRRLDRPGGVAEYRRLVPLGEAAARLYDQPDAGIWEFRGRAHVHTYSAAMCWVACDRLARIALQLELADDAGRWRSTADGMRARILEQAWNADAGHLADAFGGTRLDASLLLLADIGFLRADDPRFVATVEAIGRHLLRDGYLFRYVDADDFGEPETAFTVCSFWYIEALAAIGRRDDARALFESLLARRTALGLLSEDLAPASGEQWGNFPQTYSMVGLIHAAIRLSRSWEELL